MQPDVMVPDPGNPYDLNRYMYVRGNPTNANDPSGHVVNILAGALIGGAIGFGLYAWNETVNGDGLQWSDWQDALVATAGGAIAGGLIGSGAGAVILGAGVGMGGNLLADHLGNLANGEDFDPTDHSVTGAFGAITGALGGSGMGIGGRVVTSSVLGTVEASFIANHHGEEFGAEEIWSAGIRSATS